MPENKKLLEEYKFVEYVVTVTELAAAVPVVSEYEVVDEEPREKVSALN